MLFQKISFLKKTRVKNSKFKICKKYESQFDYQKFKLNHANSKYRIVYITKRSNLLYQQHESHNDYIKNKNLKFSKMRFAFRQAIRLSKFE